MKQIAILVAMLFVLTGCNTNKRRNIVILVDNSASITEDIIQRYIATIQNTILPNMGEKDKLALQFIDGCSQGKAERIFTVDLAEVNFENDADGINHKADSSNMRRMIYMAGVTDKLAAQVVNKRRERKDCGQYTDIINAIIEAKTLVENRKSYSNATNQVVNNISGAENYVYETCLIIFSDMVNEDRLQTYDFTSFGKLKREDIEKKTAELKEQGKIPDLPNVKVIIYGATSTNKASSYAGKQIENIKYFWELYFQSAGADLIGYGYDTKLELKKYLIQE